MKKRLAVLLAAVLTLTTPILALAKAAPAEDGSVWVETETALTTSSWGWWEAQEVPVVIEDTDRMALIAADGTVLYETVDGDIDYAYSDDGSPAGVFAVSQSSDGAYALIDCEGNIFSDYLYQDFVIASPKWVLGIVLAPGTEEDHDYSDYNDNYYIVDHVDVYYNETMIGTLAREYYWDSYDLDAKGDFLVVATHYEGVYYCYDKNFNSVELHTYDYDKNSDYWLGNEYYEDENGVMVHISGQPAFTAECTLTEDSVEQAFDIAKDQVSVVDLQGNVVATMPFVTYELNAFQNGYAVVEGRDMNGNWKYGVINRNFELVVPLMYDEVGSWSDDICFLNGYARVESNGKFGYVNEAGEEVVPVTYSDAACKNAGDLISVMQDLDGNYRLVTATKGMLDAVYTDCYYYATGYYSPVVVVADESGMYGVVDYNGNTILPCQYDKYDIDLSEDGSMIVVEGDDGATIYKLGWDFGPEEAAVEPMPAETEAMPAETEAMPAETEAMPAETEAMPAETEAMPAETEAMPAETEAMPAETEAAPVDPGTRAAGDMAALDEAFAYTNWNVDGDFLKFDMQDGNLIFTITSADGSVEFSGDADFTYTDSGIQLVLSFEGQSMTYNLTPNFSLADVNEPDVAYPMSLVAG